MEYLILGFLALAFCHFFYESIVAPTVRARIRFDLFVARARLNIIKRQNKASFDERHYVHLRDSLNSLINHMYRMELLTAIHALMCVKSDAQLRKVVDARARVLDDCNLKSVKDVRASSLALMAQVIRANCFGWFFFLFPFVYVEVCYTYIRDKLKILLAVPDKSLEYIAPEIVAPPT